MKEVETKSLGSRSLCIFHLLRNRKMKGNCLKKWAAEFALSSRTQFPSNNLRGIYPLNSDLKL